MIRSTQRGDNSDTTLTIPIFTYKEKRENSDTLVCTASCSPSFDFLRMMVEKKKSVPPLPPPHKAVQLREIEMGDFPTFFFLLRTNLSLSFSFFLPRICHATIVIYTVAAFSLAGLTFLKKEGRGTNGSLFLWTLQVLSKIMNQACRLSSSMPPSLSTLQSPSISLV